MKKFVYSLILIGSFAFYTLLQSRLSSGSSLFGDEGKVTPPAGIQLASDTTTPTPDPITTSTTPTSSTPSTTKSNPTPATTPNTPATTPVTKPKGQYKDGSYTGIAADAYYGYIQVKAVISGGKLTDVVFLQYPNDRRTSIEINTQAMPYLKAEAIQAQSANVNTISGASDSSEAFRQSLSSALSQAKV